MKPKGFRLQVRTNFTCRKLFHMGIPFGGGGSDEILFANDLSTHMSLYTVSLIYAAVRRTSPMTF